MQLKEAQQLRFKCKKCNNNWKLLENVAIVTSNCKSYKSNKVIVKNKCRKRKCKNKCKSKVTYCYKGCVYKISVKKCKSRNNIEYKIKIIVQPKID